jgi:hypothetical protein
MTLNFLAGLLIAASLSAASMASAEEPYELAARRAVLERDQQSAAFALRLRQSQEELALPPGSTETVSLKARHLRQRQSADALAERQQGELMSSADTPPGYPEARFERERRAQRFGFEARKATRQPVSEAPKRWAPTLERPRSWTPTLQPPSAD